MAKLKLVHAEKIVDTALAEARNYSCTACRMTIRPQAFNNIRRGESIYECENCGRILFFKAEASAS